MENTNLSRDLDAGLRRMRFSCIDSSLKTIIDFLSTPDHFHRRWNHADDGKMSSPVEESGSEIAIDNAAFLQRSIEYLDRHLEYIENKELQQALGEELQVLRNDLSCLFGGRDDWPSDITPDDIIHVCQATIAECSANTETLKRLRAKIQLTAKSHYEPRKEIEEPLTPLQVEILLALDGKALTQAKLAAIVCGGDEKRLHKPGGLPELKDCGKVANKRPIGYYRPDRPPVQKTERT